VTSPYAKFASASQRAVKSAERHVLLALPSKKGDPAPSLPPAAFRGHLGGHQVLAFLPSWEMADVSRLDYADLSEVAYFALQVEPHGAILRTGQGYQALTDGSLGALATDAHRAGVRVLLTLYTGTPVTLRQLAEQPASSGVALADRAATLLSAYGLDGVDLDLEGRAGSESAGFARFVAVFSRRLRSFNPTWSIVLDTLPQSAAEPNGFYDVRAIEPYVSSFFVMAYDMSDLRSPGATAPLDGPDLSDASALASYVSAVPPAKVILGIPFYGYDFKLDRRPGRRAKVTGVHAVTYDAIAASGHAFRWDPSSATPYTAFKWQGRWHETYFDDPASVALKVALAASFGAGGVGAWDLGMAVGHPQMTSVLDGGSPPRHLALARRP
jgi:spore germination protein